jgi:AraC-like DNA-binding protein
MFILPLIGRLVKPGAAAMGYHGRVSRPEIVEASSAIGWEMVRARPSLPLRAQVIEYVGWREFAATPINRRELPTEVIPVIINFGDPIRIYDQSDPRAWTDHGSFATGAYDSHVIVGSAGASGGLQINFTILGARQFFGHPLKDMTNLAVPLADLMGAPGRDFCERLRDAGSWAARFAMVDREIARRMTAHGEPAAPVTWAWHQLRASAGRVSIGALVDEIGWSQKHFISRFRDELGLAPKTLGRVLRFARAVEVFRTGRACRFADLAADCGYYDQAHFIRDVRQFAGVAPRDLVNSVSPVGGFVVADLDA